jgi:hypothetical protein
MSKTVLVEIPDAIYDALQQMASTTGATPAEMIVAQLVRHLAVSDGRTEPQPEPIRECVHPDILAILEQVAPKMGKSMDEAILNWKARYGAKTPPQLSPAERRTARDRLLKHAGAIDTGDPNSSDNERIDADLAREYQSTHEEQP